MKKKINTQLIGIAILAILATAIGLTLVYFNLLDRQIKVDLKINADILRDVHYFETDANGWVIKENGEPKLKVAGKQRGYRNYHLDKNGRKRKDKKALKNKFKQ